MSNLKIIGSVDIPIVDINLGFYYSFFAFNSVLRRKAVMNKKAIKNLSVHTKTTSLICLILLFTGFLFSSDFEKKYNLKSKIDKKNGITWYTHKNNTGTNSRVYLYFGKIQDADQFFLRMVIAYYAPSRLIVEEYRFTIDDQEHVVRPRGTVRTVDARTNRARMDQNSDESAGICEIYDIAINEEEYELMEKLSQAKTVKLRYKGVKGFKRVKIHKRTINAIKDVLNAFKELIGVSNPNKDMS